MMPLGPNEFARRDGSRIEFAAEPVRVRVGPISVACTDGHELRVLMQCSAMSRTQSADRRLFSEILLSNTATVGREDLAAYLLPSLKQAADSVCNQPLESALSEECRRSLLDRAGKALDAAAFSAGFMVLPPFGLEMDSPSFQQQQRDNADRGRQAARAAAQLQQVRHAVDVLQAFESIRVSAPNTPAGEMLEQIAPADRTAVLEATLAARATDAPPAAILAVAGTSMIVLDLSHDPPTPHVVPLPDTIGPLRSIRVTAMAGESRVVIGARSGVWLLDQNDPGSAKSFSDPMLSSQLGFNGAVVDGDTLFGTHAEGGLVRWNLNIGNAPATAIRSAELIPEFGTGARCLQRMPGDPRHVVFTIGNRIVVATADDHSIVHSISDRPIVSLLPTTNSVLAVHDDGTIAALEGHDSTVRYLAKFSGGIVTAALLPWLDGYRVLLSRDGGAVECVGFDDTLITRFYLPHSGAARPLAASAAAVVAGTNDRQRICVWSPANGKSPIVDLHLPSLTKHRLADFTIA